MNESAQEEALQRRVDPAEDEVRIMQEAKRLIIIGLIVLLAVLGLWFGTS